MTEEQVPIVITEKKQTLKDKIIDAFNKGTTPAQIAIEIDRTLGYVSCTISRAKKAGLIKQQ